MTPRPEYKPVSDKFWLNNYAAAKELAAAYSADMLALAWRVAMEREAQGHDQFNKGHLT
jgi:hypothetical protein